MPPLKCPAAASSRAPGSSGIRAATIEMPAREALTISPAWPRKPKPVMSVAPFAPDSRATSAATRFSPSMLATAPARVAALAWPSFAAVVITPVPSGFDRKSRSPGLSPPLTRMRSGWTRPVTHSPYFGSLSTTVWPPAMTPPASATFSLPPRKTSAMIAFDISRGNPATASANSTSPPIA